MAGEREVQLTREDTSVSFGFALSSQKNGDKIVVTVRCSERSLESNLAISICWQLHREVEWVGCCGGVVPLGDWPVAALASPPTPSIHPPHSVGPKQKLIRWCIVQLLTT